MVQTSDHHFVIGQMAKHTAKANRLQFVGGGIDAIDIINDEVDLAHNVLRELYEELGVSTEQVETIQPQFLKTGGPQQAISILYDVKLALSARELRDQYEKYIAALIAKGDKPEFSDLILLRNDKEMMEQFITRNQQPKVDYLIPVLQKIMVEKIKM
nr:NUDIX domain-containing protein [Polycladospora coralii]